MALLTRVRRPLAIAVIAILVLPVAGMVFSPAQSVSRQENRSLAPPPAPPRDLKDWVSLPRRLDAYLGDHFAFREQMLGAASKVERALGGRVSRGRAESGGVFAAPAAMDLAGLPDDHFDGPKVVSGRGGRMFLVQGLLKSTGHVVNKDRAADYVAFVCEASARLKAKGVKVTAGLAPSPGELLPDAVPAWAGPARSPTETDLILGGLGKCGIGVVDLRGPFRADRPEDLFRKLDSHWTPRGSVIAFNAVARAMGRPDWVVPPDSMTWRIETATDGDLPRLAGLDPAPEQVARHDRTLPSAHGPTALTDLRFQGKPPFVVETGRPGPSVLIIGDSFTETYFPPLFFPFVSRVAWIHEDRCRFDWRVIDRLRPDHVVILPAAREAICDRARPQGF